MRSNNQPDNIANRFRMIISDIKAYVEKRLQLLTLNSGEQISRWIAVSIQRLAGAAFLLLGLSFLLVAAAIYLGELLNSRSLGYVLVSVPLLAAGTMFVYLKPSGLLERIQRLLKIEFVNAMNRNEHIGDQDQESSHIEPENTDIP